MFDRVPHTIAIIGAGFSGTATAVHLLRRARDRPTRILLIERVPEFGRGLAYARADYPFLLNVPASRMSATVSDPEEFLRFARRRNPQTTGEDFLPRELYGDYLQYLLKTAAAKATSSTRLDYLRGEVVDLAESQNEQLMILTLADGTRVSAHDVVLALGAPLRRMFDGIPLTAGFREVRKATPQEGRALEPPGSLLIIGTGLTMVDVVCATVARNPSVTLHAISRHGLIPPSQTAFRPDALGDDSALLAMSAGSTARLVAAARRLARETERRGGDWREVVTLIRRQAPALWRSLSNKERERFIRHVRTYWDIHRHRLPPATLSELNELRSTGKLTVHAGRLLSISTANSGVRATWKPRGSERPRTLDVHKVIDCTGLEYNVTRAPDPLWKALLARGLATPDGLMLGIRTGACGALIGGGGAASRCLFYVGPMLRADYWEATAVGELRTYVEQLARHLMERSVHHRERQPLHI